MLASAALHPYPTGWYAVAFSDELAPQQVKTVHYLGQDIVLFRTERGEAVATRPYCPHLGAHLGHGGVVQGETIRCPFHHWRFGSDGGCVEVPGASKLPPKARLAKFPLLEQDGVLFVFHDAAPGAGEREPFPFPALGSDGYTENRTVVWRLRSHPQEICENSVDIAHLYPIHSLQDARVIVEPVLDGASLRVLLGFTAPGDVIGMPGQDNQVELEATLHGLGRIVARTSVRAAGVHARQAIYCTPIEGYEMDLRGVVNTQVSDDLEFTRSLAELFYEAFLTDFVKDFPIWENKAYVERPVLSAGDGPVGVYRRWSKQFYPPADAREPAQTVASEQPQPALPRTPPLVALARDSARGVLGGAVTRGRAALDLAKAAIGRPVASAANGTAHAAPGQPAPASGAAVSTPAINAAPAHAKIGSAREYFDTLPARFVAAGSRGVDAVFQWKLSGADPLAYYAIVKDGGLEVCGGEHARPSVTISMDAADYVAMVNGDLDGTRAFTSGRAKLAGSLQLAMKMRQFFPQG